VCKENPQLLIVDGTCLAFPSDKIHPDYCPPTKTVEEKSVLMLHKRVPPAPYISKFGIRKHLTAIMEVWEQTVVAAQQADVTVDPENIRTPCKEQLNALKEYEDEQAERARTQAAYRSQMRDHHIRTRGVSSIDVEAVEQHELRPVWSVLDMLLRYPELVKSCEMFRAGRAFGKLEFGALPVLLNALSFPDPVIQFMGGNTPTMLMSILATNNAANKQLVFSGVMTHDQEKELREYAPLIRNVLMEKPAAHISSWLALPAVAPAIHIQPLVNANDGVADHGTEPTLTRKTTTIPTNIAIWTRS
jgi:hypothetical protein